MLFMVPLSKANVLPVLSYYIMQSLYSVQNVAFSMDSAQKIRTATDTRDLFCRTKNVYSWSPSRVERHLQDFQLKTELRRRSSGRLDVKYETLMAV